MKISAKAMKNLLIFLPKMLKKIEILPKIKNLPKSNIFFQTNQKKKNEIKIYFFFYYNLLFLSFIFNFNFIFKDLKLKSLKKRTIIMIYQEI
jgi:hypothetical protein